MLNSAEHENLLDYFIIYELSWAFYAQLSWAWKKIYNLGARF